MAEAVTLAHLARPLAVAAMLDVNQCDIMIASSTASQAFITHAAWQHSALDSIDSRQFLQALARGTPVFDAPTLRRYVKTDLDLIERFQPDLIIGDFRLSLSISARLAKVPYASITNAYWSPHYRPSQGARFPLPVLPVTRWLPVSWGQALFDTVRPLAFARHCAPLNQVRQEHGLPSLGNDLCRIYTDADHVLYADIPELFPIAPLPPHHHYLGPLLWSPPLAKPDWWDQLNNEKPIIYVTLGSSGQASLLPRILSVLSSLPAQIIVAQAGAQINVCADNIFSADYLPGTEAAARAQLVICNGGSLTCQQALMTGVPVIGIASNMDQFMNMQAIVSHGAGVLLRADRFDTATLRQACVELLHEPGYQAAARQLAETWPHHPPASGKLLATLCLQQAKGFKQANVPH